MGCENRLKLFACDIILHDAIGIFFGAMTGSNLEVMGMRALKTVSWSIRTLRMKMYTFFPQLPVSFEYLE